MMIFPVTMVVASRTRSDNASRVSQITEPRGVIGITGYSLRNELKGITEPTGSPFAAQSFTYDAAYNRATWTRGATTTNYAVNNLNEYTTVSGSTAPTWNSDGGLAVFAGNTYTYDAMQRLIEVDYSGGKTLFSYDPLGRRVKKVDQNSSGQVLSTFQYHYDGSEVAVEYQPSTTWTYYLGLGLDQVVLRDSETAKQWYYRDGHGSTSAVTDNSGNVLEKYEYNAQGQFQITNAGGAVQSTTQIANDLLYTGRNYDYETGNYFYRARYYNPTLGRFISRDPLSGAEFSQGTNLYAYCQNNYLNSIDPTGMCKKSLGALLGSALSKAVDALSKAQSKLEESLKSVEIEERNLDRAIEAGDSEWIQRADTAVDFAKQDAINAGKAVTGAMDEVAAASLAGEGAAVVSVGGLAAAAGTIGAVGATAVGGYELGTAIDQIPIGNGNTIGSALTNGVAIVASKF